MELEVCLLQVGDPTQEEPVLSQRLHVYGHTYSLLSSNENLHQLRTPPTCSYNRPDEPESEVPTTISADINKQMKLNLGTTLAIPITHLSIVSNNKGISRCGYKCLTDLISVFLQSRLILIQQNRKKNK